MIYDLISSITAEYAFVALSLGVIIGACLTLTGVGGGVLIIPALQLSFDMQVVMAVGTASIIASLVKLNAAYSHIKSNNVEWQHVKFVLLGAIPMIFIATDFILDAANSPEHGETIQHLVQIGVVGVMVVSFVMLLRRMRQSSRNQIFPNASRKGPAVGVGMLSGTVLGATGIGGGVILLPALTSTLGCSIKKAVGTSIVIALVLSSVTALIYSGGSQSHIAIALFVALGSAIGVPLGIRAIAMFAEATLFRITLLMIATSLFATLFSYISNLA
jgi:uncharacterized membrane protein YfcA